MTSTKESDRICLEVFSMISASISHEIKNCLAIINETAGLLEDYGHMLGDEGAVPVEQTNPAATSVMKQVNRANLIMKEFNTFSHNTDEPFKTVDCRELVDLLICLSKREAAGKKLTVQHIKKDHPVSLRVDITAIESLIYLCLLQIYRLAKNSATISLDISMENNSVTFTIKADSFTTDREETDSRCVTLADHLDGSCEQHDERVVISIPLHQQDRISVTKKR